MEAEFLFKSQFDKSLKLLVGGIIFAFSIQPLFLASCPRALLPPEAEWVYKIPKTVVTGIILLKSRIAIRVIVDNLRRENQLYLWLFVKMF